MKRKEKDGVSVKAKRQVKSKNEYADLVSVSVIVFLLDKLTDWVYRCLIEGFFGRIFTAYSSEQAAFERSAFRHYFVGSKKTRGYFRRTREFLSDNFESSFFIGKLQSAMRGLQMMSLRAYGNFWMSFGIFTILIYFIRMFLPFFDTADMGFLITGIVIAIASLPLVSARGSLVSAVGKSRMLRSLCMDAFGFREEVFERKHAHKRRTSWTILLGMLCGMITFFLHPLYVPLAVGVFVTILLVFATPEIGILLSLFAFPFFSYFSSPTLVLAILVATTFASYWIKLIRGKRILRFELYDLMILLFGITVLFGGMITAGGLPSYEAALISCVLMLGYFLVVNLMRTKAWIRRCFEALVSSATVVSLMGIWQFFFGKLNRSTLDLSQFSDIKGRVTVLFDNANILGFYLAMVFPLALYILVQAKTRLRKIPILLACTSMLICLILTYSRGAWIACLVSVLIFFLIYSRKTMRYLMLLSAAIPTLAATVPILVSAVPMLSFLLPDNVIKRFLSIGNLSDSSSSYRIYTWQGTLDAIRDFFLGGAGYGTETYGQIYPSYAYAGMETAEHSHNLFLQIWFSLGIFALIVFLFVIILFIQRGLETIKVSGDASMSLMTAGVLCGGIAMLVMGLFDYVWFSYRIFFLFWIFVGLVAAVSRINSAERQQQQQQELLNMSDSQRAVIDWSL